MKSLMNVWSALGNLAAALNSLANVVNDAGNRLRLQLDYEPPAPALPHNGEVIDNADNGAAASKRRKVS